MTIVQHVNDKTYDMVCQVDYDRVAVVRSPLTVNDRLFDAAVPD